MKNYMTATKARQNFFKLLEQASQPDALVTITMKGQPKVVMMPLEDFESWQETLEIMSDPELVKGIAEGEKDIREGNVYSLEEVKKKLNLK